MESVRIYISFEGNTHDDQSLLDIITKAIHDPIHRIGGRIWSVQSIEWGDYVSDNIEEQINKADIFLLLLSQSYLSKKAEEIKRIYERYKNDNVYVLPLVLSPFSLKGEKWFDWIANIKKFPHEGFLEGNPSQKQILADMLDELKTRILAILEKGTVQLQQKSVSNIHIMTSVKGGVGKTLISLALVCAYLHPDVKIGFKKLLGIDVNFMNTDFYKFLSIYDSNSPIGNKIPWRKAFLDKEKQHTVIIRQVPYSLPKGTLGFWKDLTQVIEYSDFSDCDIIIDTNLHIANLTGGSESNQPEEDSFENPLETDDLINRLFAPDSGRKLFIWIFWTFSSLKDPKFVEKGIENLLASCHQDVVHNIEFIHVWNPSALIAPSNDFDAQIEELARIRQRTSTWDHLIELYPPDHPDRPNLEQLRHQARAEYDEIIDEADFEKLNKPHPFPGLYELINEEVPTKQIDIDALLAVGKIITDNPSLKLKDIFSYIYNEVFRGKGRPKNLLPISYHDPKFKGYTDEADTELLPNLEDLWTNIDYISRDVRKFLDELLLE